MPQVVVGLPQYPQFLNDAVRAFLKILQDSDPSFIGENNTQVSQCCYLQTFTLTFSSAQASFQAKLMFFISCYMVSTRVADFPEI